MSSLSRYADIHPHLERVACIKIKGGEKFVIHNEFVYLSSKYGGNHQICVIDISQPEKALLKPDIVFKNAIANLALKDNILFAPESYRAINFIDLSDPNKPNYFDCCLMLDRSMSDIAILGDYAFVAMSSDGVALVDISDLTNSKMIDSIKLDEGSAEAIQVVGKNIIVACGTGGVRVFNIEQDKIVQVACHQPKKCYVQRLFKMKNEIWAVNTRTSPESVMIIDSSDLSRLKSTFEPEENSPQGACFQLSDGNAVAFSLHYSATVYAPSNNQSLELFKMYSKNENDEINPKGEYIEYPSSGNFSSEKMEQLDISRSCLDDVSCAEIRNDYLYAVQSCYFNVYKITNNSVFKDVINLRARV